MTPLSHAADGLQLYTSLGFIPRPSNAPPAPNADSLALVPLYRPASNWAEITITTATSADVSDLAPINRLAFLANPNDRLIYGNVAPADRDAHNAASLERALANPNASVSKAVKLGKVVGFAVWHWPSEADAGDDKAGGGMFDPPSFPPGADEALVRGWVGAWDLGAPKGSKFAELELLVVLPEEQGKGVGKALLEHGLGEADDAGLDVYLLATAAGVGPYLHAGFEKHAPLITGGRTDAVLTIQPMRKLAKVKILPATVADVSLLAPIQRLAFAADIIDRNLFANCAPADADAHVAAGMLKDLGKPSGRMFKVLKGSKVVGVSVWKLPAEGAEDKGAVAEEPMTFAPGSDIETATKFFGLFARDMPESAHIYLKLLIILPEAQGRGIGKSLLKWGLDYADEHELEIYLHSSLVGQATYIKAGFEAFSEPLVGGLKGEVWAIPMRRRPGLIASAATASDRQLVPPPGLPLAAPTVHPATAADLPQIAAIFRTAFGPSGLYQNIWGKVEPAVFEAHWVKIMAFNLTDAKRAQGSQLVVVKRGPDVVGFSLIQTYPPDRFPEEEHPKMDDPEGTDLAVKNDFFPRLHALEQRITGPYLFFHIIATSPAYFRTGAARAVLQHGIAQADAAGLDCYLDASPDGYPVYVKQGFERDGEDLVGQGAVGSFAATPMRRRRRFAPPLPPPAASLDPVAGVAPLAVPVLVPATAVDLPLIGAIFQRAFAPSVLFQRIWSKADPAEVGRTWALGTEALVTVTKRAEGYELYVVKRGAEVVGYTLWQLHSGDWSNHADEEEDVAQPAGTDMAVHDHFFTNMHRMQLRIKEPHLFFHLIATDPAFFRTGAARAILHAGIAKADALGIDCYLDATEAGLPVYVKFGFERDGADCVALTGDFAVVPMRRRRAPGPARPRQPQLPLHAQAATPADLAAVGAVFRCAFEGGDLFQACWGAVEPSIFEAWQARQFGVFLTEASKREGYELLVVRRGEGQGQVAAFGLWQRCAAAAIEAPSEAPQDETEPDPAGTHTAIVSDFYAKCDALKARINGPHYFLHALATDPTFARQGCARVLIEHGLQQADAAGWDVFLDASAQGKGVYERWGFEQDGPEIVGLGGSFREVPMRRSARGRA